MGYRAAFQLIEIAKQGNLLGDSLIRNMIRAVTVDDDPEIEEIATTYISYRAIDNMMGGYR